MSPPAWTREDLLLGGGLTVALAASADAAWSLHARFAADLTGLSVVERAGAALWDFRPLATAVFAAGAVAALTGLRGPAGRLALLHGLARDGLALLAAAQAALALVVLALASWVAAAGELGGRDELGFVYSPGERAVTLVTQVAAWLPLAVFLAVLGFLMGHAQTPEPAGGSVGDEMEALWRERLAFGPRRERARALLARIQALEAAGDHEEAGRLAEEMRGLVSPTRSEPRAPAGP
jgi:hypothetical protein